MKPRRRKFSNNENEANNWERRQRRHAPFVDVKPRAHINTPWYDRQCQQAKATTRRLKRAYRCDMTESNREAWRRQSAIQRQTLRQRYVEYWSATITANANDSKALWSKVNVLLKTPESASSLTHTADDFANFFQSKISKIRQSNCQRVAT